MSDNVNVERPGVRVADPFTSMADHLQVEAHDAEGLAVRLAKDPELTKEDAARHVARLAGVLRTAAVALHEQRQPVKRPLRRAGE